MVIFFQVILPQASEEYGPISHYYLIVVPEDESLAHKHPDQFLTDEMIAGAKMVNNNGAPGTSASMAKASLLDAPYIAAKFPQRNIPYTFHLGSGDIYDGFTNRR